MEISDLQVKTRAGRGKEDSKRMRRQERIPAVFYQHGEESIALDVSKQDFFNLINKSETDNLLLNIVVDGKNSNTALVSEIQTHPVSDEIIHVDFHGVSMSEKIEVKVAIHTKGEAPGVKEGGVLEHIHHEIHVECLPGEIPEVINVDVSQLNIGDKIHISEIAMPANVVCLEEPGMVILAVAAPTAEEEEEPAAEEGVEGEESAEPEVIKKGKEGKEEEEGSAAEGEAPAAEKGKKE